MPPPVLLAFLTLILTVGSGAAGAAARFGPEVGRALERDGRAVVAVVLRSDARVGETLDLACRRIAAASGAFVSALPPDSCHVRYRYRYSPVVLLEITEAAGLTALERAPGVVSVHLDERGTGTLNESKRFINADQIRTRLGLTGRGRVVAVLDTGADTDHPDLEDAIIHQFHFLDQGFDVGEGAEDDHGHGTNVTGIITSRGSIAPVGIAPEAEIVAVKVLDRTNSGWVSDWAAGVEHVIDLHRADNGISVDVINMSLASNRVFAEVCDESSLAFSAACRVAVELGITIVAASGNVGSKEKISIPSCFSSVIAVTSMPDTGVDRISGFANRNELVRLAAPGETITSTGIGGGTSDFRGTSQATPHVAALAALVREVDRSITPGQVFRILELTGSDVLDVESGRHFVKVDGMGALAPLTDSGDCDGNGVLDWIEIHVDGTQHDCDGDGLPDTCAGGAGVAIADLGPGDGAGGGDGAGPCTRPRFVRGDVNADGTIDISDGQTVFNYLFLGVGVEFPCLESADVNNDGRLDVSDGIWVLGFLFRGEAPPPGPPAGTCGTDIDAIGTPGDLGCESFPPCMEPR